LHHRTCIAVGVVRALVLGLALALVASSANAAVPSWTTYNHDGLRTATDPDSGPPVTSAPAWSADAQLDGQVYA
jgi:hypothetical protein